MTETSLVRLGVVREATPGTTPASPRLRAANVTGINLEHSPTYQTPSQLRADRMQADAEVSGENNAGSVSFELTYPRNLWPLSEWLASLANNPWANTPQHDNDGTADSVITAVGSGTGVFTVVDQSGSGGFAGSAYVVRHLVRASDFTNAGNNGLFRVTASTATSITVSPTTTVAESAPPADARLKVVGFEGASGDITATATGLASTALDFTTLGLQVGQWIKIGGTGAAFRFGTEALNGWARIVAIAANALTLDNRPTGWTTDSGTGKTLRCFFGDVLKNGVTRRAVSMEQGYMGQATPTYVLQAGMQAVTGELSFTAKQKVTGTVGFLGMSGDESDTTVDANLDPELDSDRYPIFTCSTNVGRIAEAGAPLAEPNFCRSARWSWTNNGRSQEAIDVPGAAGIGRGVAGLSIALETYFGSRSLYAKAKAGTVTSLSQRLQKLNNAGWWQAVTLDAPRGKLMGFPTAPGPDQDSMLNLTFMPSRDALTGCHYLMNRVEYFEP